MHNTVAEFIPLTMKTIILQLSGKARQAPDFNREAYVDFVAVQIKFLSFLAYIIRIYQDQVRKKEEAHTHTHTHSPSDINWNNVYLGHPLYNINHDIVRKI